MDRLDCDRMFVAVAENGSFAAAAVRVSFRLNEGFDGLLTHGI